MSREPWSRIRVADLVLSGDAEVKTGPFGTQLHASDYVESGTPVINVRNIGFGGIRADRLEYIADETVQRLSGHLLRPGDIVFGRKGAVERHVLIREGQSRWFQGSDCLRLRLRTKRVLPQFLSYHLLTHDHQQWMMQQCSHGATMASLNQDIVGRIEFLAPGHSVQEAIASILSSYDDLIENNTRRIAILEEMARRIYEEWFVRFRFPGHEGVRMVETELGSVPQGWPVVPASTAIDINPTTKVPKDGLKPFLAMNCLSDCSMLIDSPGQREGNSGSKFRNGDTLFARITPCLENGKTGFVQFLPDDASAAFGSTEFIVLRSRTVMPEFVYLLARSDKFRDNAIKSMSGASGRQRVREACFDTLLIANPDSATLSRFEALVRPMFKLVHTLALKNANLRATRDLLLPRLISGELDVSAMPEPEALAA